MEIILPPKYYLENFLYLLDFVSEKYSFLLKEAEKEFIYAFKSLKEDEQCWYVRFANRKGHFFKTYGLSYDELSPLTENIAALTDLNFIEVLDSDLHVDSLLDILKTLTKPELICIFGLGSKYKKEELVDIILFEITSEEIIGKLIKKIAIVKQGFVTELSFLKFLFFGNRYLDMTEFVLADLGLVQYHKINQDSMVARFSNRKEAEDKWFISDQYLIFSEIKISLSANEIFDWYLNLRESIQDLSKIAQPAWEKLQLNIGKYLEQQKDYEKAIALYKNLSQSPAQEREIRCHEKLGNIEIAKTLLKQLLKNPQNTSDEQFANFFLQKLEKKKEKKISTLILKDAREISVSMVYKGKVEMGALAHFIDKGYEGNFSENFTWRTIFGLLFWDIIFDPAKVAFHHPFQRRPSDLHLPDFYEKRQTEIHDLLDKIKSNEDLLIFIQKTYLLNFGKANPFVVWFEEFWEMSLLMATEININSLKEILLHMTKDISENTRGFPDLLVWNSEGLNFIEIKGPNDTLSSQQVYWIDKLNKLNIKAEVLKVVFEELKY